MPQLPSPGFLCGVIEGFYGPPWARSERQDLCRRLKNWGLNTYFYCPKDDWKQRAIWREAYTPTEAESLKELIETCTAHGLHFIYALSPGLDIRYSRPADLTHLRRRFEQMMDLGCSNFALLFDDIPDQLDPTDLEHWGSLASAQAHVANAIFAWTHQRQRDARFLFCPTPYCGRMAAAKLGGPDYLANLGRDLHPDIDILWTGPEIISREISVAHVRELAATLRRPPILWDNLHANDYDGRRFFCGPYSGRRRELLSEVRGILTNPNCEYALNHVPLRTLADFVKGEGPWDPRAAYLSALREWHAQFVTCGQPISFDDLLLLADCYYLPHEDGTEAVRLFALVAELLGSPPTQWGSKADEFRAVAKRLRETCARTAELHHRTLFYALGRRTWELREEMDLLERYVSLRAAHPDPAFRIGSDFHLPGTYRGSFVARLQSLLTPTDAGDFVPSGIQVPLRPAPASSQPMNDFRVRLFRPGDEAGADYVCLKTGDHGKDGEAFYREDPNALGRIFVEPYLAFEPELSLILEDQQGICGYALAAFDSRCFYDRYEREWRPRLCAHFPAPTGDPATWTRTQTVYHWYHHPDYYCPEPYAEYPSHLHIDLLQRAQGRGFGRRMMDQLMAELRRRGSPGAHLGVSVLNKPAQAFYTHLGFRELARVGTETDGCIYMGLRFT